jgi:hypothetical protein
MTRQSFEVWALADEREDYLSIEARDAADAAAAFCEHHDYDLDVTEVDVCVAVEGSDDVETFSVESQQSRDWCARKWPPPLVRFGAVIREAARWINDTPRREAADAEHRAWKEEYETRRELREALELVSRLGEAVRVALAARDALRDLGLDDEDHESAARVYFALAKVMRKDGAR